MVDTSPALVAAVRQFLAQRRRRCMGSTMASYEQLLGDWLAWRAAGDYPASLGGVTLAELRAYHDQLGARCQPRTVHNHYRTLRAFWRWLGAEADDAGRPLLAEGQRGYFAPGRIDLPRVVERQRPAVTAGQVEQLLAVCGDDEEGHRNAAMVLMLWESGVRVHELAALDQAACDLAEREALIVGKGRKQRYVWWGPRTASALLRYLRVRRGPLGGPVFRGVSSRNNGDAMTANAVRLTVKRLARRAGVRLPRGATVHGFRHGCARELRRRGCTKEEVRDILGHEDMATTQRYLGLDVEAPRAAHRRAYGGGQARERAQKG